MTELWSSPGQVVSNYLTASRGRHLADVIQDDLSDECIDHQRRIPRQSRASSGLLAGSARQSGGPTSVECPIARVLARMPRRTGFAAL